MIISESNPIRFNTFGSDYGVSVSYEYIQPFNSESTVYLQIQTNTEPLIKLIDEEGNETIITPFQTADRTSLTEGGDCFLYPNGSTETMMYFSDGQLPYYLKIGQVVTIDDGGANNGTYTITNLMYSEVLSAFTAVFSHTYARVTQQPTYSATFDKGSDIWECAIPLTGLSGCYYIDINGTQSNIFSVTSDDIRHITYSNSVNDFGIMYNTGIVFDFDINAKLYEYESGGSEDIATDDEGREIVLDATYFRALQFEATSLSNWMCEKLDLIFKHDTVFIDNVGYVSLQESSINSVDGTNLFDYSIQLQEVEPLPIDEEENYIIVNATDYLLPNANGRVKYA